MAAIGGNTAGPGMVIFFPTYTFNYLNGSYCHVKLINSYVGHLSFIGDAVVNVYINHEKKFAFVEMRSVEEASNAMALDGIIFEVLGLSLTIIYTYFMFEQNLLWKIFFLFATVVQIREHQLRSEDLVITILLLLQHLVPASQIPI